MENKCSTSAWTVWGKRSTRRVACQAASLTRNAVCKPVTRFEKKAVAISVSPCVRSAVRRKPGSADTPISPRTDLARVTSNRGSGPAERPECLIALQSHLNDLTAAYRLAVDQAQFRFSLI